MFYPVSTYDIIDCDSILIEKSALESLNLLLGLIMKNRSDIIIRPLLTRK